MSNVSVYKFSFFSVKYFRLYGNFTSLLRQAISMFTEANIILKCLCIENFRKVFLNFVSFFQVPFLEATTNFNTLLKHIFNADYEI